MTKRVLALAANGFEDVELIATRDILIREGFDVDIISFSNDDFVRSAYNLKLELKNKPENVFYNLDDYFALFIPGGSGGVSNLEKSEYTNKIIEAFYKADKFIGAICLAPTLLAKAGILNGKQAVVYPDKNAQAILLEHGAHIENLKCKANEECSVVIDGKIITGLNMPTTFKFAYAFADLLRKK